MSEHRSNEVWCVVMFDLPTETRQQRSDAAKFRKLLMDAGFSMIQYSVYGRYSPTFNSNVATEKFVIRNLPEDGEVRIFHLTDHQWASATRYSSKKRLPQENKPEQLVLL